MVAKQFIFNLKSRPEPEKKETLRRNMEHGKGQEEIKYSSKREREREIFTVSADELDRGKRTTCTR
jgi:hypothetical protein